MIFSRQSPRAATKDLYTYMKQRHAAMNAPAPAKRGRPAKVHVLPTPTPKPAEKPASTHQIIHKALPDILRYIPEIKINDLARLLTKATGRKIRPDLLSANLFSHDYFIDCKHYMIYNPKAIKAPKNRR